MLVFVMFLSRFVTFNGLKAFRFMTFTVLRFWHQNEFSGRFVSELSCLQTYMQTQTDIHTYTRAEIVFVFSRPKTSETMRK